jgi:hypothetical protein
MMTIVEAVIVDVAGRGDLPAELVEGDVADDREARGRADVVGEVEVERELRRAAAAAEDDIGLAGVGAAIVVAERGDEDVVEAVAVHVARGRHVAAGLVVRGIALDGESDGRGEILDVDGREAACLAVDHVGGPGIDSAGIRQLCADQQIVEAVAVDVPGRGDAEAELVAVVFADNGETLGRTQRAEVDVGEAARLSEQHIGRAGAAAAFGVERTDDDVVEAVAIDVAGGGDADPR